MKSFAVGLSLIGLASAASAQGRPFTPRLSCGQTAQIVYSTGAIVLSTSATTYDRYVRDGSFCLRGQTIEPAWVATADTPQCFIGYRCVDGNLDISSR
jgi:hypothetical protein